MTDIFVLSAVRTAIGAFGGALSGLAPHQLASRVATAALDRSGTDPRDIESVVFGHVINTEPKDMYLSRVAALNAGIPETVPAMNVNRLCGSGAQAVVSSIQALRQDELNMALAGGAECMSRSPHVLRDNRWGKRLGDVAAVDMMVGVLTCPMGDEHMGSTAENVAEHFGVNREDQDAFAAESQRRAARAIAEGRFEEQIVPVEVSNRKGTSIFDQDEHPTPTTIEKLAQLRPVFRKNGTVTAGNASGVNDGAAALVLAREAVIGNRRPLARVLGYSLAGVDPSLMGIGPVPAVKSLCKQLGLSQDDFDVIESNEAFAAQALAVSRQLDLDPERVNPNGGAVALGHPIGATGAALVAKALHELDRIAGQRALVTMCIGGGQGIAVAFERA